MKTLLRNENDFNRWLSWRSSLDLLPVSEKNPFVLPCIVVEYETDSRTSLYGSATVYTFVYLDDFRYEE